MHACLGTTDEDSWARLSVRSDMAISSGVNAKGYREMAVDAALFLDKDGEPLTWYEVLERVCKSLGLRIYVTGWSVEVVDALEQTHTTPTLLTEAGTDAMLGVEYTYQRAVLKTEDSDTKPKAQTGAVDFGQSVGSYTVPRIRFDTPAYTAHYALQDSRTLILRHQQHTKGLEGTAHVMSHRPWEDGALSIRFEDAYQSYQDRAPARRGRREDVAEYIWRPSLGQIRTVGGNSREAFIPHIPDRVGMSYADYRHSLEAYGLDEETIDTLLGYSEHSLRYGNPSDRYVLTTPALSIVSARAQTQGQELYALKLNCQALISMSKTIETPKYKASGLDRDFTLHFDWGSDKEGYIEAEPKDCAEGFEEFYKAHQLRLKVQVLAEGKGGKKYYLIQRNYGRAWAVPSGGKRLQSVHGFTFQEGWGVSIRHRGMYARAHQGKADAYIRAYRYQWVEEAQAKTLSSAELHIDLCVGGSDGFRYDQWNNARELAVAFRRDERGMRAQGREAECVEAWKELAELFLSEEIHEDKGLLIPLPPAGAKTVTARLSWRAELDCEHYLTEDAFSTGVVAPNLFLVRDLSLSIIRTDAEDIQTKASTKQIFSISPGAHEELTLPLWLSTDPSLDPVSPNRLKDTDGKPFDQEWEWMDERTGEHIVSTHPARLASLVHSAYAAPRRTIEGTYLPTSARVVTARGVETDAHLVTAMEWRVLENRAHLTISQIEPASGYADLTPEEVKHKN